MQCKILNAISRKHFRYSLFVKRIIAIEAQLYFLGLVGLLPLSSLAQWLEHSVYNRVRVPSSTSNFFNEIRGLVPKGNTSYNMKEAWTPEVILAINFKGEFRVQHKLSSNERALNFQKNEPSLIFIRQLVLEISRLKVTNIDVAIFLISSLIFV